MCSAVSEMSDSVVSSTSRMLTPPLLTVDTMGTRARLQAQVPSLVSTLVSKALRLMAWLSHNNRGKQVSRVGLCLAHGIELAGGIRIP